MPGEDGAFLINAYGMMYEEITASSLIKIAHDSNILAKPDFGVLDFGVNMAGYVIQSAAHEIRNRSQEICLYPLPVMEWKLSKM